MKTITTIILSIGFFLFSHSLYAQKTSRHIFVDGACGMCKSRIEKAAKQIPEITEASWNTNNKQLTIELATSEFDIQILHKKLAAAGHDTKNEKASQEVYNNLPECCKYRTEKPSPHLKEPHQEQNHRNHNKKAIHHNEYETAQKHSKHKAHKGTDNHKKHHHSVTGTVLEKNAQGKSKPLVGANVYWVETNKGTITNKDGFFSLPKINETDKMIVSFVGYTSDTIQVQENKHIEIVLSDNIALNAIDVVHRRKSTEISFIDPVKVQSMGEKELLKAACCNLSESFETNPSVDVTFTDAITGTRQIKMLGLAGNYVQITRENMPDIRGLAALYGFTFTPGTWIEGIQLNKGTGSVVNGFESIAGQINVELKKPEKSERLYLNLYANQGGRLEANLNLAHQLNNKWATGLLIHGNRQKKEWDKNEDTFIDHPLSEQAIVLNRWKYKGDNGLESQFGIKATYSDKTSGQKGFNDQSPENLWGAAINSQRIDAWGKVGKIFDNRPLTSLGFQIAASYHQQDALFGKREYDASQTTIYSNLIFQSFIVNTAHLYKTGLSLQSDIMDENVATRPFRRDEIVPGAFFEYTWKPDNRFTAVTGIRTDWHNNYGFFLTPRLHIRYAPLDKTVIRLSAGRGVRTASIFAENIGIFASNRIIHIENSNQNTPYGLEQEKAWNAGINFTQEFALAGKTAIFGLDFYRTEFENQIVIDFDRNPQAVYFYNLEGKSLSNSIQTQIDVELLPRFDVRIAYRYNDVKTEYSGELLQKPLTARHRSFINLAYTTRGKWNFDFTLNRQGKKRIPSTETNPSKYQKDNTSPAYYLANAQISKKFGEKFVVYLGGENIFDFTQQNPIIAANAPFSPYFDSSLIWGPVFGRKMYLGIRLKIK